MSDSSQQTRKRSHRVLLVQSTTGHTIKMPAILRAGRSVLDYNNAEEIVRALPGVKISGEDEQSSSIQVSTGIESSTNGNLSDWIMPTPAELNQYTSYKPNDPSKEADRLTALREYMILETEREEAFDEVTKQTAVEFDVPCAIISFVDMGRLWFKSIYKDDFGTDQTCREHSFCTHTIQNREDIFIVPNATEDNRFASNPLVTSTSTGFRFYAGVPLEDAEGQRLGALCILDRKPRPNGLSEKEQQKLKAAGQQVVDLLTKRKEALRKELKVVQSKSTKDKLLSVSQPTVSLKGCSKRLMADALNGNIKRARTESVSSARAFIDDAISRGQPTTSIRKPTIILPNPATDGVDPDTYLSQLVEAIYGTKPNLKTGLELGDFFPVITEEQMSAYSMDVTTMARNNDVEGLRGIVSSRGRDALDCFNRFGEGLLNITCRRGFNDSVKFLLSDEVNLNVRVRDDFGRTPLHDACWNPEPLVDICTKLMEKDPALFFITDKRGYTAFQYARKTDWPQWRNFLFDRKELLAPLVSDEIKSRFSS